MEQLISLESLTVPKKSRELSDHPFNSVPLRPFIKLMTEGQGKKFCKLAQYLGERGNRKLPATTAIFNFSSATYCASKALGLCPAVDKKGKNICYAMKAERLYPEPLKYRQAQGTFWRGITAEDFAVQFLIINALKERPFDSLRFSEAGDFLSQKDVDKAEKVAMILNRYKIKTYCYTARKDLEYSSVKHLVINGSSFEKEGVANEFRIIPKGEEKPKGYFACPNDCRTCNRCQIRGQKIAVMAH
tara:strand:- start:236 stop:970 length:735 start_codon:yes stop_codon:yes gene_type:complete